ncbi:MAG TPA: GNAT family N-acetyltransferase [Planctomycetaceae bacterium]|nr:GNAT family N-acetyltransferase [Planctomycetaceae bacterium]
MSSTSPTDVARKLRRSGWKSAHPSDTASSSAQQSQTPTVISARAGDHLAIHKFLLDVFHGPSNSEFTAQLENPLYEPSDRLMVKHRKQIIGHVKLQHQQMHFGRQLIPMSNVSELATAPEYRQRAIGAALLQAAEQQIIQEGSFLGTLETNIPEFYRQHGWTVSRNHSFSTAAARNILSYVSADRLQHQQKSFGSPFATTPKKYNIRLWRHVEQEALVRLFHENTVDSYGPFKRSEDYWRWLFSRRGFERIYVAIDGPDKLQLNGSLKSIISYAVIRHGRIMEIMTSRGHEQAAQQLVERVCTDILEQEERPIRIDAPPGHPLHEFLQSAGGQYHHLENHNGIFAMMKLFDPLKFLEQLRDEINQRAQQVDLARPFELGLEIRGNWYQILFTPRSVKLVKGKSGRSHLRCDEPVLTQLLLGHLDVQQAVEQGILQASTRIALETAATIFPQLPLWQPPLDNSPA